LQLVTADSIQAQADNQNQSADNVVGADVLRERVGGIGNSRPPSFQ